MIAEWLPKLRTRSNASLVASIFGASFSPWAFTSAAVQNTASAGGSAARSGSAAHSKTVQVIIFFTRSLRWTQDLSHTGAHETAVPGWHGQHQQGLRGTCARGGPRGRDAQPRPASVALRQPR